MNVSSTTQNSRNQAILQAREILKNKPVYLDTETTGLDNKAEIIEISIVDDDGNVLYNQLFKPSQPISPGAMNTHHITDEMLKSKPGWAIMWPTVRGFLFGKWIGMYNADFDLRMIQQSQARYGLRAENLKSFDVMKLYSLFRGVWDSQKRSYKYFSLENAALSFKIPIPQLHRSSDDTLLTRAVMHAIAETTTS